MNFFYILGEALRRCWSNGEKIRVDGKSYSVHKMSYGDYFLEPLGKELPESEGFAVGTLWLEKSKKKCFDNVEAYTIAD